MGQKKPNKELILAELRQVIDPELQVNIVDLGLVYGVRMEKEGARIKMTLTSPYCPLGSTIRQEVEERLKERLGLRRVKVEFVFDPPWNPQKMTKEVRARLGF